MMRIQEVDREIRPSCLSGAWREPRISERQKINLSCGNSCSQKLEPTHTNGCTATCKQTGGERSDEPDEFANLANLPSPCMPCPSRPARMTMGAANRCPSV